MVDWLQQNVSDRGQKLLDVKRKGESEKQRKVDKELKDRAKLQSGVRKRWNGKVRGERAEKQGRG